MNPHAIAQALVYGDWCEYGRLMGRNDYVPPSAVQEHKTALDQIPVPTPPRPTPAAATQPSQGGGVGSQTE
jgi:hypothetical protein